MSDIREMQLVNTLPEIQSQIFKFLPRSTLLDLRMVCKAMRERVNNTPNGLRCSSIEDSLRLTIEQTKQIHERFPGGNQTAKLDYTFDSVSSFLPHLALIVPDLCEDKAVVALGIDGGTERDIALLRPFNNSSSSLVSRFTLPGNYFASTIKVLGTEVFVVGYDATGEMKLFNLDICSGVFHEVLVCPHEEVVGLEHYGGQVCLVTRSTIYYGLTETHSWRNTFFSSCAVGPQGLFLLSGQKLKCFTSGVGIQLVAMLPAGCRRILYRRAAGVDYLLLNYAEEIKVFNLNTLATTSLYVLQEVAMFTAVDEYRGMLVATISNSDNTFRICNVLNWFTQEPIVRIRTVPACIPALRLLQRTKEPN